MNESLNSGIGYVDGKFNDLFNKLSDPILMNLIDEMADKTVKAIEGFKNTARNFPKGLKNWTKETGGKLSKKIFSTKVGNDLAKKKKAHEFDYKKINSVLNSRAVKFSKGIANGVVNGFKRAKV